MDLYSFALSKTQQAYDHKPKGNEISKMIFQKQIYTIDSFLKDVRDGFSFAYVFKDNDEPFTIKQKTKENFEYTKVIVFDVDHSSLSMGDQIDLLELKPSIAYTTPTNDPKNHNYKFRLVYCFYEKIRDDYYGYYNALKDKLKLNLDNCMATPNQFFNGNNSSNVETYSSYEIYSTKDIPFQIEENQEKQKKNSLLRYNIIPSPHLIVNELFLNDFQDLSYWELIDKYRNQYGYGNPQMVALIEKDDYLTYPDYWFEIPHKKGMVEVSIRGETKRIFGTKKWEDGDKRHYWIFQCGIMYKNLIQNITPEHLLYLLVYEIAFYYDNSDGKFTKKYILDLLQRVMASDKKPNNMKHGAFKVDKSKLKDNENAFQKRNEIRKRLNFERIGELYDCSLTDRENLAILKENGVTTSISTLKRFRKEMGIPTKGRGRPKKKG